MFHLVYHLSNFVETILPLGCQNSPTSDMKQLQKNATYIGQM